MSEDFTGRYLLNTAIEWYKENGSKPIPKSEIMGNKNFDGNLFHSSEVYHLDTLSTEEYAKNDNVSNIQSNIFPLLAGIAVGFSTPELTEIIKHHHITVNSVSRMDFSTKWVSAIPLEGSDTQFITHARICIELAKACFNSDELQEELISELSGHKSGAMIVGSMHIDDTRLWPAGMIEKHAEMVMSGTNEFTFWKRFQGAVSEPCDISELPGGSPVELMKRSGMLTEPVIRKQTGYFDLWEDVVFEAGYDRSPQIEVLKYIANTQDKSEQELFIRGLLSISSDSTHHEFVGQLFHQTLVNYIGMNPVYAPVVNSIILKLNLETTSDYRGGFAWMAERMSLFDDVYNNQETLLSRVAEEILSRPGNNLGLSELRVFTKLDLAQLPTQKITFSPEELLNKVLDSWGSYVTSARSKDREKSQIDTHASESIKCLVKLLGRDHSFDYDKLKHNSDDAKVLLIESGLEVRKFKGLSRRALGKVLENDMGM